jgi:hypothetical protein
MNDHAGVTADGKLEGGTPRGGRVGDREPDVADEGYTVAACGGGLRDRLHGCPI